MDVDQFAKNPEALSPEEIDKLLEAQANGGDEPAQEPQEGKADAESTEAKGDVKPEGDKEPAAKDDAGDKKAEGAPKEEQPTSQEPTDEFDPRKVAVKTKDGKHEIPYEVYDTARKRASSEAEARRAAEELAAQEKGQREVLQRQLSEMQQRLQELEQRAANPDPDREPSGDQPEIASDAEIEAIEQESPELARVMRGFKGAIARAEARAEAAERQAREAQERLQQQTQATARSKVEEVIANSPKLVYLREKEPERYNEVAQFDKMLASNPRYQTLSLSERIAKAVSMYEAANGVIQLPGTPTPAPEQPKAKSTEQQEAPAPGPHTLSDLPGGALPRNSEIENVDELSVHQLADRMMRMGGPQEIQDFVGKLPL